MWAWLKMLTFSSSWHSGRSHTASRTCDIHSKQETKQESSQKKGPHGMNDLWWCNTKLLLHKLHFKEASSFRKSLCSINDAMFCFRCCAIFGANVRLHSFAFIMILWAHQNRSRLCVPYRLILPDEFSSFLLSFFPFTSSDSSLTHLSIIRLRAMSFGYMQFEMIVSILESFVFGDVINW